MKCKKKVLFVMLKKGDKEVKVKRMKALLVW